MPVTLTRLPAADGVGWPCRIEVGPAFGLLGVPPAGWRWSLHAVPTAMTATVRSITPGELRPLLNIRCRILGALTASWIGSRVLGDGRPGCDLHGQVRIEGLG